MNNFVISNTFRAKLNNILPSLNHMESAFSKGDQYQWENEVYGITYKLEQLCIYFRKIVYKYTWYQKKVPQKFISTIIEANEIEVCVTSENWIYIKSPRFFNRKLNTAFFVDTVKIALDNYITEYGELPIFDNAVAVFVHSTTDGRCDNDNYECKQMIDILTAYSQLLTDNGIKVHNLYLSKQADYECTETYFIPQKALPKWIEKHYNFEGNQKNF